jgi:hypothetical protein
MPGEIGQCMKGHCMIPGYCQRQAISLFGRLGQILAARSVAGFDRIFRCVFDQFGVRGGFQVNAGVFGDQQQINQHVGAFVTQRFLRFSAGGQGRHVGVALPLRQLEQFAGFKIQRNDQVAQAVELRPVPLVAKRQDFGRQRRQVHVLFQAKKRRCASPGSVMPVAWARARSSQ